MGDSYLIRRAGSKPPLQGKWDGAPWDEAETLSIDQFRSESSDHRPQVQAKLLYDAEAIYVFFGVRDRYVIARHENLHDPVCRDSCCEFFVQPKPDAGYINFEMNCGGTLLANYVWDHRRESGGPPIGCKPLAPEVAGRLRVYHSMPKTTPSEIEGPTTWKLEYAIPFSVFEEHVGPLGDVSGQTWRANLYKCADACSHPHWATWAPIDEKTPLNFHLPEYFGELRFE